MSCRDRNKGSRCSMCWRDRRGEAKSTPTLEKSLGLVDPNLSLEWSNKNNCTPFDVYPDSQKVKRLWVCSEGHPDYLSTCSNRRRGKGCPKCSHTGIPLKEDSFGYLYPSLEKEWSSFNSKSPFEVYPKSNYQARWVCERHGEYVQRVSSRVVDNYRCPSCWKHLKKTRTVDAPYEQSLAYLYPNLAKEWSPQNSRSP